MALPEHELEWSLAAPLSDDRVSVRQFFVGGELLRQLPQEHLMSGFIARGILLALGNQPFVIGNILAMHKAPHTFHCDIPLNGAR
jgi:hypothetical protein